MSSLKSLLFLESGRCSREVGRLEPDTIIDLEQGVNEPLKLVCGDRHIADGELVMVDGGGVGIRITKVLGKEEVKARAIPICGNG